MVEFLGTIGLISVFFVIVFAGQHSRAKRLEYEEDYDSYKIKNEDNSNKQ